MKIPTWEDAALAWNEHFVRHREAILLVIPADLSSIMRSNWMNRWLVARLNDYAEQAKQLLDDAPCTCPNPDGSYPCTGDAECYSVRVKKEFLSKSF